MKTSSIDDLRHIYGVEFNDPDELQRQAQLREHQLTRHRRLGWLLMMTSGRSVARTERRMRNTVEAAKRAAQPRGEETGRLQASAEQLQDSARQQQSMIEYVGRRNAYSFVKDIPRRPYREGAPGFTGSYRQLAVDTLSTALTSQRQADNTVSLLGANVRQRHAQTALDTHTVPQIAANEEAYNDGVATALWQLGFIETERGEEDIPQSRAQFSPTVTWSEANSQPTEHGSQQSTIHRAQLPFDANNELHAMLVPDNLRDNPALAVELEFSPGSGQYSGGPMDGEFMNLRVVPVEAPQA